MSYLIGDIAQIVMVYLKAFDLPIRLIVFISALNFAMVIVARYSKEIGSFFDRFVPAPVPVTLIESPTVTVPVSVPTLETRHAMLHLKLVEHQSLAELMRKALKAQGRRFISIEEQDLFFRLSQTMPFYYTNGVNSGGYANDPSTLRR